MTPLTVATLTAAGLIVLAAAFYATLCREVPFTICRRCHGSGNRWSTETPHPLLGRKVRPCRRCAGVGRHLRTGRALFNYARRIHREATTTTMPPQRDPKKPPQRPGW